MICLPCRSLIKAVAFELLENRRCPCYFTGAPIVFLLIRASTGVFLTGLSVHRSPAAPTEGTTVLGPLNIRRPSPMLHTSLPYCASHSTPNGVSSCRLLRRTNIKTSRTSNLPCSASVFIHCNFSQPPRSACGFLALCASRASSSFPYKRGGRMLALQIRPPVV